MKSTISTALFVLLLSCVALPTAAQPTHTVANTYVHYSATFERPSVKPGGTDALLFRLTPRKGIHINTTPPISFTLDSTSGFTLSGTLKMSTVKVDTNVFLDTAKAIVQSFTAARTIVPGRHIVKGTFVYFYCSDSEGWCSKFKQPVELPVTVAK